MCRNGESVSTVPNGGIFMEKTPGKYVKDGNGKSISYLFRHFSKVFLFWVYFVGDILSQVLFPLAPAFEKFRIRFAKEILERNEAVISKSFDDVDEPNGYRSHLLFNCIWFLLMLGSIAIVVGLAFFVRFSVLSIYEYSMEPGINNSSDIEFGTNFIFIPFGILAFVVLFFFLMVKEAAVYIMSTNPKLGVGDIFYDALEVMKRKGGTLVAINVLHLLSFLTLAALYVIPVVLVMIFVTPENVNADVYLAPWINCILTVVFFVIYFFVLPFFFLSRRLALLMFMQENCKTVRNIVVVRKTDSAQGKTEYLSIDEYKEEPIREVDPTVNIKTKKGND